MVEFLKADKSVVPALSICSVEEMSIPQTKVSVMSGREKVHLNPPDSAGEKWPTLPG